MSMVECKQSGGQVSQNAETGPHCGAIKSKSASGFR
jgi:hypothetical protein